MLEVIVAMFVAIIVTAIVVVIVSLIAGLLPDDSRDEIDVDYWMGRW